MCCDNEGLRCVSSISDVQEMRVLKKEEDVEGMYIYIYIYMCKMEGEEAETKKVWLFASPRKKVYNLNTMMIIPSFRKPIMARDT